MHDIPNNAEAAVDTLMNGTGIFVIEGALNTRDAATLRDLILTYKPDKVGSIKRLLDKSPLFEELLFNAELHRICQELFRVPYQLSQHNARIIHAGEDGEGDHRHVMSPHIDFPYREVIGECEGVNSRYRGVPMGLQVFVPLTDLTEESGATAYIPGSQNWFKKVDRDEFEEQFRQGKCKRLYLAAGSMALWSGPIWHTARPNITSSNRVTITMLFMPRFMKHPHDMRQSYRDNFKGRKNFEEISDLLAFDDPHPIQFEEPLKATPND